MGALGIRDGVGWKPALQRTHEEEPQGRNLADHRGWFQLPFVQQVGLILANMLRTESIGRFVEESREALDSADVSAYSCLREVTSLEFLQHDFAKTGHRDLLVTRTLLLAGAERLPLYATRSVRRASGFVQVAMS
jgi:hypothetical protein